MKRILLSASLCCAMVFTASAQDFVKADFLAGYTLGQDLENGVYTDIGQDTIAIQPDQWSLAGKGGTNDASGSNPKITAALTYSGYVESGEGVAIDLTKLSTGGRTSIYSMAGIPEEGASETYGPGTYYLAFMVNVSVASLTTQNAVDFLSFDSNYTGNSQRARFCIKGIDADTYQIGLGNSGVAPLPATPAVPGQLSGSYNLNETYLAVLKLTINPTGNTGTSYLIINPAISATEPTDWTWEMPITGFKSIRGLVIRQRNTIATEIGGLRFSNNWAQAIGYEGGQSVAGETADKGNVISVKYFNLNGVEVKEPVNTNSVYVKKAIYEDGSVVTTKVVK